MIRYDHHVFMMLMRIIQIHPHPPPHHNQHYPHQQQQQQQQIHQRMIE